MENQILDKRQDVSQSTYKVIQYNKDTVPEQIKNMILSRFLRSLRRGNEYFRLMDKEAYFKAYNDYLNTILNRPSIIINVAVLSDDIDVALGWALMEPGKLHYVYVKDEQRRQNIGKSLLTENFSTVTHLTNMGLLLFNKYNNVTFNPFG